MSKAEIDPRDLRQLNINFRDLKPERVLKGELLPFVRDIKRTAAPYPPDFPGNTYKRTGNLGRSWQYVVLSPLSAEVSNAASYAGFVQGHEQMSIHAGHGWKYLHEVGDSKLGAFIKKIEAKIDRIWTR